jgi:hypothetical protein
MFVTLEALGNIGEFLGAIGVVISLAYLGLQIRQNTNAIKASSHHSLNDSFSSFLELLINNRRAAKILEAGIMSLEGLNDEDRDTFYAVLSLLFNHFENTYFHYQRGLLEEAQWTRWRIAIGWYVGFPGVAVWWANRAQVFSEDFGAFVSEQQNLKGPTDPAEWAPNKTLEQLARPRG